MVNRSPFTYRRHQTAETRRLAGSAGERAYEAVYGIEAIGRRGVDVIVLDDLECVEMMHAFITSHPELWNEDIAV